MERLKDIKDSPCFFKHGELLCKLFLSIKWPDNMQDIQTYDYYNYLKSDFIENDLFLSLVVSNVIIIKNQTNDIHLGVNMKDT